MFPFDYQGQILQGYPLHGLHEPFYCSKAGCCRCAGSWGCPGRQQARGRTEKKTPTRASVSMVERENENGCHKHISSQGESQLPPVSPQDSLRSASMSDPDSFQTATSTQGLGASKFLYMPSKDGPPASSSKHRPHWFSKPDSLVLIFPVQDGQAAEVSVGLGHLAPQAGPPRLILLLLVSHEAKKVNPDGLCLRPPTCQAVVLCIFSTSSQVILRDSCPLSSVIHVWQGVNLGSSYAATLIPLCPHFLFCWPGQSRF